MVCGKKASAGEIIKLANMPQKFWLRYKHVVLYLPGNLAFLVG